MRRSNTNPVFTMFLALFGVIALCSTIASAYMAANCYLGNDPNSMACYMISDRHEIGIRRR